MLNLSNIEISMTSGHLIFFFFFGIYLQKKRNYPGTSFTESDFLNNLVLKMVRCKLPQHLMQFFFYNLNFSLRQYLVKTCQCSIFIFRTFFHLKMPSIQLLKSY